MSEPIQQNPATSRTTMDAGEEDRGKLTGEPYTGDLSHPQPQSRSTGANVVPEEVSENAGDLHVAFGTSSPASFAPPARPAPSSPAGAEAHRTARADTPESSGWNEATERQTVQAGGEDSRSGASLPARTGVVQRSTTETQIALTLNLDGRGQYTVSTGIRFLDHMLELFTRHGGFDLTLKCNGDLDVDQHHTVEDVGIALGEAFEKALGDKKGILRAGYFVMAMDETLAVAAVDLSGRVSYAVDDQVTVPLVGDLQTELLPDFFDGFARGAKANVHVKTMYGRSNHHKIEAIFKAFARALRGAVSRDERMKDLLPSTKGLL